MFGYITVNRDELKIKDYNRYRAYYCGVCRCLRDRLGSLGRLTLSFDMTFLAILLDGLYDLDSKQEKRRCAPHMIKAHDSYAGEAVSYAADMNILLAYDDLRDKWFDSGNPGARFAALMLKRKRNRIAGSYPDQAEAVDNYIQKLRELEKKQEKNIEAAAGLTGDMLGEIYAFGKGEWSDTLKQLGFYMGKFVYLADAYEDYERDVKKGAYNPFVMSGIDPNTDGKAILNMMAAEAARAFERLPIDKNIDILRNIIYSGMWGRINKTTDKGLKNDGSL